MTERDKQLIELARLAYTGTETQDALDEFFAA